jgi:predicted N-acetyltransferase YhbS
MIRPYTSDDLEKIATIADRAWRDIYTMFRSTYGDELFSLMVADDKTSKGEQVRAHCRQYPDWALVCEKDGRLIGFITFSLDDIKKIGRLGNNAVDPECGLKGIGQQLYAATLDYFKAKGMRFAQVQTGLDPAHAPARRAYQRAGFDISHEDVTYFKKL